jgi:hypothetical protein
VPTIFLSYATQDYFFAEMLAIKLAENDFAIWRDQGSIRAGDDWRQSIENGIKDSIAVVVALSSRSTESPYVTYEWAYAIGMGKPVIPVKLSECQVHPKLEPTAYIDFSYPRILPWDALMERLREIESEPESITESIGVPRTAAGRVFDEETDAILGYLNKRGFRMASLDRLNANLGLGMTEGDLHELVQARPRVFRKATLKGDRLGIAKRVP